MLTDNEIMTQVLAAFREEQAEHRQAVGMLLLELERTPDHPHRQQRLDQLFREAHSLKGGARAAGLVEIEQIAHGIEDVFSAVRQGHHPLSSELCDPVYAALDAIGVLMDQVAAGQPPDLTPYQPLLGVLRAALDAPAATATDNGPQRLAIGHPRPPHTHELHPAGTEDGPKQTGSATVRLSTVTLDLLLNEAGELMTCASAAREQVRNVRALAELPARWKRIWRQAQPTLSRFQLRGPAIRPTIHYLDSRDASAALTRNHSDDHETAVLIDALLEANTLIRDLEQRLTLHSQQAAEAHARLHAVSDRLHRQVRRTRMLPLTTLFSSVPLQVREMARAAGKQVALELDDGGAEADRQVLERLGEVLLHLLRNAVDHGIEPADARVAHGKAPEGLLSMRAEVSGDRLALTIADDGAGLDLAAIGQRALASGEFSADDLARMGEAGMIDLIFRAGFSTHQTVTTLSGRGVGLDIVRSRVERMQGRVTVRSVPGAGCTFTINLPLSLTSSHGLLVRAGTARYVLPLDAVQRIVPVAAHTIRMVEGRAALLLDDRPLALVQLTDLLERESSSVHGDVHATRHGLVIGSGERQIVCLTDAVLGEQELMVQRLPPPLQQVRYIAGATILADGEVVPILDVVDLVRAALGARQAVPLTSEATAAIRHRTVLVVDDSITTRTLEKNILEAAGYRVRLATDGIEALQMLDQLASEGDCDLLLSDVDMPRLNGFDLTARVRAHARFQHLPIVLVTSLDTPEDRERGIAAGADAYIVKRQFEQQALLDTIVRLI
ncbi:MAG: response regulator [Roseiflexaceae bacterium]